MSIEGTTDVRKAHRFDESALEAYLADQMEGFAGPISVRQFSGGQSNPTFLIEAAGKRYVMRKKPPGKLLPSAHLVEREYRVMRALADTDVPVPKCHLLCEDPSVIGTAFYLMSHVPGRVFRSPLLVDLASNAERAAIYDSMNETLARLHSVDFQAVGLGDFGKSGNYMARQISRWSKQYAASKTDHVEAMEHLLRWLPDNLPDDDTTTIAHGDFRLENLIIHPEKPEVIAVLDWELSTLGHPLADLAYNCMLYHLPRMEGAASGAASGFVGVDLAEYGIPSESEYVARYAERTGRGQVEQFDFYLAFGMFRLAAIVQGVYKRGLDGNASSETAKQFGPLVELFAQTAWEQVKHRA